MAGRLTVSRTGRQRRRRLRSSLSCSPGTPETVGSVSAIAVPWPTASYADQNSKVDIDIIVKPNRRLATLFDDIQLDSSSATAPVSYINPSSDLPGPIRIDIGLCARSGMAKKKRYLAGFISRQSILDRPGRDACCVVHLAGHVARTRAGGSATEQTREIPDRMERLLVEAG